MLFYMSFLGVYEGGKKGLLCITFDFKFPLRMVYNDSEYNRTNRKRMTILSHANSGW